MSQGEDMERPWGAVLAGGPGSRMGGNKPFRRVGGKRLIDRAVEALAQVCPRVLIITGDVAALADLPLDILADRWPGRGPLAALATGFLDTPANALLVLPVDLPLVNPAILARLADTLPGAKAVAAMGPRWVEPLMACYHRDCLPVATRMIEKGEMRPRMLAKAVKARILSREETRELDPEGHSFLNVNSPEDLALAERIASEAARSGPGDTLSPA